MTEGNSDEKAAPAPGEVVQQPVKRKRGRPRKYPRPEDVQNAQIEPKKDEKAVRSAKSPPHMASPPPPKPRKPSEPAKVQGFVYPPQSDFKPFAFDENDGTTTRSKSIQDAVNTIFELWWKGSSPVLVDDTEYVKYKVFVTLFKAISSCLKNVSPLLIITKHNNVLHWRSAFTELSKFATFILSDDEEQNNADIYIASDSDTLFDVLIVSENHNLSDLPNYRYSLTVFDNYERISAEDIAFIADISSESLALISDNGQNVPAIFDVDHKVTISRDDLINNKYLEEVLHFCPLSFAQLKQSNLLFEANKIRLSGKPTERLVQFLKQLISQLKIIANHMSINSGYITNSEDVSGKFDELLRISNVFIEDDNKIAIFANDPKEFLFLSSFFTKNNISVAKLDSSVKGKRVQQIIEEFNITDSSTILLIHPSLFMKYYSELVVDKVIIIDIEFHLLNMSDEMAKWYFSHHDHEPQIIRLITESSIEMPLYNAIWENNDFDIEKVNVDTVLKFLMQCAYDCGHYEFPKSKEEKEESEEEEEHEDKEITVCYYERDNDAPLFEFKNDFNDDFWNEICLQQSTLIKKQDEKIKKLIKQKKEKKRKEEEKLKEAKRSANRSSKNSSSRKKQSNSRSKYEYEYDISEEEEIEEEEYDEYEYEPEEKPSKAYKFDRIVTRSSAAAKQKSQSSKYETPPRPSPKSDHKEPRISKFDQLVGFWNLKQFSKYLDIMKEFGIDRWDKYGSFNRPEYELRKIGALVVRNLDTTTKENRLLREYFSKEFRSSELTRLDQAMPYIGKKLKQSVMRNDFLADLTGFLTIHKMNPKGPEDIVLPEKKQNPLSSDWTDDDDRELLFLIHEHGLRHVPESFHHNLNRYFIKRFRKFFMNDNPEELQKSVRHTVTNSDSSKSLDKLSKKTSKGTISKTKIKTKTKPRNKTKTISKVSVSISPTLPIRHINTKPFIKLGLTEHNLIVSYLCCYGYPDLQTFKKQSGLDYVPDDVLEDYINTIFFVCKSVDNEEKKKISEKILTKLEKYTTKKIPERCEKLENIREQKYQYNKYAAEDLEFLSAIAFHGFTNFSVSPILLSICNGDATEMRIYTRMKKIFEEENTAPINPQVPNDIDSIFPLKINDMQVIKSIGKINPKFHDKDFIYPIDYECDVGCISPFSKHKKFIWLNASIRLVSSGNEEKIKFVVKTTCKKLNRNEDFEGDDPNIVFEKVRQKLISVSNGIWIPPFDGYEMFGFESAKFHQVLSNIPGTEDCTEYQKRFFRTTLNIVHDYPVLGLFDQPYDKRKGPLHSGDSKFQYKKKSFGDLPQPIIINFSPLYNNTSFNSEIVFMNNTGVKFDQLIQRYEVWDKDAIQKYLPEEQK